MIFFAHLCGLGGYTFRPGLYAIGTRRSAGKFQSLLTFQEVWILYNAAIKFSNV